LAATVELKASSSVWSGGSIGVWRVIFVLRGEPLGWRAGAMDTSFCHNNNFPILILSDFLGQRKSKTENCRRREMNHVVRSRLLQAQVMVAERIGYSVQEELS
jgi:hypothetical protein